MNSQEQQLITTHVQNTTEKILEHAEKMETYWHIVILARSAKSALGPDLYPAQPESLARIPGSCVA